MKYYEVITFELWYHITLSLFRNKYRKILIKFFLVYLLRNLKSGLDLANYKCYCVLNLWYSYFNPDKRHQLINEKCTSFLRKVSLNWNMRGSFENWRLEIFNSENGHQFEKKMSVPLRNHNLYLFIFKCYILWKKMCYF